MVRSALTVQEKAEIWRGYRAGASLRSISRTLGRTMGTLRMLVASSGGRVDNGAEFMAEFEQACATRGIRRFVLPPRSPKLHGTVERANRTHTEEFYELTDAETGLASLQAALRDWETVYNTVRPQQALGYPTPAEYLASVGVEV
jgi:transposase InsO family protein